MFFTYKPFLKKIYFIIYLTNDIFFLRSDDAPPPVRLRRPRAQGRSHSGCNSHASASSQEQNSVPIAPARDSVPAAPPEPGVMSVELLVQQPGRHHLPMLHPVPEGHTTWFVYLFVYLFIFH